MRSFPIFALALSLLVVPSCDDATTYPGTGIDADPSDVRDASDEDVLNAPADAPRQPAIDASVEAG